MILTKFNRLFVATFILLSTLSGCLLPKKVEPVQLQEPVYLWYDGVAIEMQPPAGYYCAENFVGFYHDSLQISISFNVVEKYFDDFAKDYSKENFESTGIQLFSREELIVDGKNALLFHSEYADGDYALHHLRLGIQLGSRTLQIEAIYSPSSGKGTKDYLTRSFLSMKHLKNSGENQFQRLGYEVNLVESPLRLIGVSDMTCLFETTADSLENDGAAMTIGLFDYPFEREDTNVFIREMMEWRAGTTEIEIESFDSKVLNGMHAWTASASHYIQEDNQYYQFFEGYLFLDEAFYRVAGVSSLRNSFWEAEFKRIMGTFKIV